MKPLTSLPEAAPAAALTTHLSPTPSATASSGATNLPASAPTSAPAPATALVHAVTTSALAPQPAPNRAARRAQPPPAVVFPFPQIQGLTLRQRKVLDALIAGSGPTVAAQIAGVSRSTVFRWTHTHYDFIAALNAWRNLSLESAGNELVAAAKSAAITVAKAVRQGNVTASLALLKGLGALAAQKRGATRAQSVRAALERDELVQAAQLAAERYKAQGTHSLQQSMAKDDDEMVRKWREWIFAQERSASSEEQNARKT